MVIWPTMPWRTTLLRRANYDAERIIYYWYYVKDTSQAEERLGSAVLDLWSGSVESGRTYVIPAESVMKSDEKSDPFLNYTNYCLTLPFSLLSGMISATFIFPVIIFVQRYGLNLIICTDITMAGQMLTA